MTACVLSRNFLVMAFALMATLVRGAQKGVRGAQTQTKQLYTHAVKDRSGRQLLRSLMLDAYVFANSDTWSAGGQCISDSYKSKPDVMENFQHGDELMEFLGLPQQLRYDCPTEESKKDGQAVIWNSSRTRPAQQYFTSEWHQSLLDKVTFQYDPVPQDKVRVAVHVRRGDISPCESFGRYVPNTFFLEALARYLPQYCGEQTHKECEVTIYSETLTFESFQPFQDRGYKLNLGGSLEEVYRGMINADVLVLSESAFSYVPALFNKGVVIYPGLESEPEGTATEGKKSQVQDMPPLPHWTGASEDIRTSVAMENAKLKRQCASAGGF